MNNIIKILITVILIVGVFIQDDLFGNFDFGLKNQDEASLVNMSEKESVQSNDALSKYFVNDSIYQWDEQMLDWVALSESLQESELEIDNLETPKSLVDPIEVDWKKLMDIQYKLRYFPDIDLEIYAPYFPKSIEALHKKEVIIEGFVIPFDEEEELLALSHNPFASCFFCGKASPASVISMYLKDSSKRYKVDDFKKFKGTLYLNYDDPNEFYYILKDAVEL